MENIILENTFEDAELITFIHTVTNKLYEKIKDDFVNKFITDINDENEKIEYAKHKMNVILDICRDSSRIKNLSKKYINSDHHDSKLYHRYMLTLQSIFADYLQILYAEPDYNKHKNKIIHLYSGMKTVPYDKDTSIISLKHPIDTTLRPIQAFTYNTNDYYINFNVKLDDTIIPIIGNCYKKFTEMDWGYHNEVSEYEFLYIGNCDVNVIDKGIVRTSYKLNYNIYTRMYPIEEHKFYICFFKEMVFKDCNFDLYEYVLNYGDMNKITNFFISKYLRLEEYITEKIKDILERFITRAIILRYLESTEQLNRCIHILDYLCLILTEYILFNSEDEYNKIEQHIINNIDNIVIGKDAIFNTKYTINNTKPEDKKILNTRPFVNYLQVTSQCTKEESFKNMVKNEMIGGMYYKKYMKYKIKYITLKNK